jgi:outer membrane protein OmpA-like peptidoglycan-associated protein
MTRGLPFLLHGTRGSCAETVDRETRTMVGIYLQYPEGGIMNSQTSRLLPAALSLALASAMGTLPARAADAADDPGAGSKQSDMGAVTGIVVGALAAGPVGAVIGGGAGALIGDRFHRQAQSRAALAEHLDQSEAQNATLTHSVAELNSSLAQEQARGQQLEGTLQHTEELGLDVGFRTNDDSVTAKSMSPLLKLGALVASMPDATVRVAGYADGRGSDACNDALSLRRAESVTAVLTSAGVPRERIFLEAHGKTEASAADGDVDGYALDRRVTVRLQRQGAAAVARRD